MADIKYIISVDSSGATTSIKQFDDALRSTTTTSDNLGKGMGGLWKQFAIGQLAADALKKAIGAMSDFMRGAISLAAEQELAEKNLADALAITGRSVDALLPKFKAFASEIQKETVYTDDAVLSVMALLAQLTNLDEKGLKQATKAAIGMATVFKVDLQSAATVVAKAMAGNYDLLARYLPALRDLKTEEEKHAFIMQEIGKWYERARGETDTYAGSVKQLNNMWGEVKETVGRVIINNDTLREGIKDLAKKLEKLASSEDFKLWLNTVIDGLMKAIGLVEKFGSAIKNLTDKVFGATKADKELAESYKKLHEAMKRAAEAGHNYEERFRKIKEIAEKSKPPINEVGNVIKRQGEEIKKTTKIIETYTPKARSMADVMKFLKIAIEGEAIPAQRKLNGVLEQARDTMYSFVYTGKKAYAEFIDVTEKTTNTASDYFNGLYNDIATGWGNTIQKYLEGGLTLREFFGELWNNIKTSFFRMIGEMISKWILDFIGKLITSSSEAASTISSVFSSIGSSFAGTLGIVVAAIAGFAALWHSLWKKASDEMEIFWRGQKMTVKEMIELWHKLGLKVDEVISKFQLAKKYAQPGEPGEGKRLPPKEGASRGGSGGGGGGEEEEWPFPTWQRGFEGIITRPIRPLIGEVPEYVSVRPLSNLQPARQIVINITGPLLSATGLSRSDLERAGEELFRIIRYQATRVGGMI